jgi:protein farnesyltransferase subunit beta
MIDDGLVTQTSKEQHALEQKVAELYCDLKGTPVTDSSPSLRLLREEHIEYLHEGLGELPAGFASLDAGRPWICFWIIHSLSLLNAPWPAKPAKRGGSLGVPAIYAMTMHMPRPSHKNPL